MKLSIEKHSITQDAALALAQAAIAAARARNMTIGVCVTDSEGAPMALLRMEQCGAPIADFAREKAYTSAVTGAATRDFHAHITSSPSLAMGMTGRPNFLVWAGGLPIRHDGTLIGGIGVSGGSEDDDVTIALAALNAIGLS